MTKKKMNVLVTGGTGFIGSHLSNKIKNKYNIKILDRQNMQNLPEVIQGDLRNYEDVEKALKNIDVVIHLAYSKIYSENIEIIKNIIKACEKEKVKKIILMSSMSAKRNHPDNYGKNKLEIENLIKKSTLNYTILRPSIIYGKGSKSFDFIINYLNKIPFFTPIIGSGKYKISPTNIDDAVKAIEKCIDNKKTDKKDYDLPGKDSIYFIDLINVLKKEIGVKKKNIPIPITICKLIANITPKIISKENIKNLTEDSLADIEPAKKDFNYKPIKFSEGVKNGLL